MKFEDIYKFFHNPPPHYLNRELAVCYILSVLLNRESYGTELIECLEKQYPNYRLSDTVLYSALKFLEQEKTVTGYWRKVEGRGRPRRMYQVCDTARKQAEDLAQLWLTYTDEQTSSQAI
ncbi:PadR family transcriptional regulator [Spirulina sp. CS-785/01]|uniref:PadR family transcriptional regulator n=1 Tax=Spirulina sp. CS-785/01 TaxID=3021716 RepID=UPI00232E4CB9|nr:PadR family transcriptional regulator [Spirulina sp. CS-785/01]MDB9313380.1 PadR family transcriptional regulator [Spirulina sp. CS-785/01]